MSLIPGATARTINVANAIVTYRDGGSGHIPVVLIHGTGGTVDTHFGRSAAMLSARYRVIGIDLATPDGAGALELDNLVDQVVAVIDELGIGDREAVVVGYSLGAVVAAAYAARRPAALGQLVLVSGWLRTDAHQRMRHGLAQQLQAENPEAYAQFAVLSVFSPRFLTQRTATELGALVQARVSVHPDWTLQMNLNSRIDLTDVAARIAVPTLVISGDEDSMVPRHHGLLLFGAIEDARFASLPTGHAVAAERPAQLFTLIDQFAAGRLPAGTGEVLSPEKI